MLVLLVGNLTHNSDAAPNFKHMFGPQSGSLAIVLSLFLFSPSFESRKGLASCLWLFLDIFTYSFAYSRRERFHDRR